MLKGIPTRISSDLLKALADMGHGDLLIIADDFYPPITKTPGGVSIQAKGNSAADMIEDILKLMPLDVDYCEYPVEYMVPDKDSGISMDRPRCGMTQLKQWSGTGMRRKSSGRLSAVSFMRRRAGLM